MGPSAGKGGEDSEGGISVRTSEDRTSVPSGSRRRGRARRGDSEYQLVRLERGQRGAGIKF